MPSKIPELCHYDAATLTRYLDVCEQQEMRWRRHLDAAPGSARPVDLRAIEEEVAFWSRFAEMLRVAIGVTGRSASHLVDRRTA